jgi:hypothetical protein
MRLIVYPLSNDDPPLRPAPAERDWMDASDQRFAYRCLPLAIANAHGWEVLNPAAFHAHWRGGAAPGDVKIEYKDPAAPQGHVRPLAHFGTAVLTFELPMMFQTEPGWNMMVTGPINRPKDGIAPLTGVVETDWSPYTFTMNWIFTRPKNKVTFKAGEPIAHVFPVRRGVLDQVEPEIRPLYTEKERYEQYEIWRNSRAGFLNALSAREEEAVRAKWQKGYFRGVTPDGEPGAKDHQTKVRVKPFVKKG